MGSQSGSNRSFRPHGLLDEITIRHEPRAAFGRFFLRAESILAEVGVTARFGTAEELLAINQANADSWSSLIPMVHATEHPAGPGEQQNLLCFDRDGRAVATSAVRRFDMTDSTALDEVTSLRMMYGTAAAAKAQDLEFELTAPSAASISGVVSYHGGVWVHPDFRKTGLTRIVPKLNRYASLAQAPYDYEIAMASATLLKPHVAASYSVEASEPSYRIKKAGEVMYEGVFNWSSRSFIIATLHRDIVEMTARSPLNSAHVTAAE